MIPTNWIEIEGYIINHYKRDTFAIAIDIDKIKDKLNDIDLNRLKQVDCKDILINNEINNPYIVFSKTKYIKNIIGNLYNKIFNDIDY